MFVMPEVVLQKIISHGIRKLRKNKSAFYDIFNQYTQHELNSEYGLGYIDSIWEWFYKTKIPVVKAWSFDVQKIPCISIHLANEVEDEQKAAFNDIAAIVPGEGELGTGVFTVMVDIGIHANRTGDNVLWLYYIVSYILFKHKMMADRFGLRLHTFSVSDYSKNNMNMAENIWTRWIKFRCTTQNFWDAERFLDIEDINTDYKVGLPPASDISTSEDVDLNDVDTTINEGIVFGRTGSDDPDDDVRF